MKRKSCNCCLVLIVLVFMSVPAYAADITLTPSIGAQGTYNDNIDFSRTNKLDDYIGTISPSLALDYATQRFNLGVNAGVDVVRHNDNTNRDYERQNYGLDMGFKPSERISINARGSYVADITLDSELQETGIVERRSDRDRYGAGGGVAFQLTEVSDLALDYSFTTTEYELVDLIESDSHTVSLPYNSTYNDGRDVVTLRPYYRNTDSDEEDVDTYGFTLGLAHTFSETFQGNISAGVRYTETEDTLGTTDDDWGWTAEVGFEKNFQTATVGFSYLRDLGFTAEGETVEVNRFTLFANKRLTSRFRINLAGSLFFTKSYEAPRTEDARYYEVTPSVSYLITENHTLSLAYSYANEYNKILTDDRKVDRNTVWLSLNFNFPWKW